MNAIEKLTERFRDFPGIGPRQSRRFVYFLLSRNRAYLEDVARLILNVQKEIRVCGSCMRFFSEVNDGALCSICSNEKRDSSTLMLLEKDVDLENVEKSGAYKGRYFVMGGTIPILEKKPEERVRLRELQGKVKKEAKAGLKEIIVAFSINAEGENTAHVVAATLRPLTEEFKLKVSYLGRGLSTGSEVEYADGETLKSALKNRT